MSQSQVRTHFAIVLNDGMRSFDSAEGTRTRCRSIKTQVVFHAGGEGDKLGGHFRVCGGKVVRFTKIGLQIEEPRLVLRH